MTSAILVQCFANKAIKPLGAELNKYDNNIAPLIDSVESVSYLSFFRASYALFQLLEFDQHLL